MIIMILFIHDATEKTFYIFVKMAVFNNTV